MLYQQKVKCAAFIVSYCIALHLTYLHELTEELVQLKLNATKNTAASCKILNIMLEYDPIFNVDYAIAIAMNDLKELLLPN